MAPRKQLMAALCWSHSKQPAVELSIDPDDPFLPRYANNDRWLTSDVH